MYTSSVPTRSIATLALLEVDGIGVKGAQRLLRRLRGDTIRDAGDLVSAIVSVLRPEQRDAYINGLSDVSDRLEELGEHGVKVSVQGDPSYPSRLYLLGGDAPLFLMIMGNISLLEVKGVGFCGSRKASEQGIGAALDLASQLGERGINVVSGYAAGVDTAVHLAALRSGGTTTIVLPLGISHFRLKNDLQAPWDWERVVVVSEFPARLPWQARNAMKRNATICALSDALVVVEAGSTGGTLAAGNTGIELGLPVFAIQYEEMDRIAPGNTKLMGKGAHALGRDRNTGRANIDKMLRIAARDKPSQASLF